MKETIPSLRAELLNSTVLQNQSRSSRFESWQPDRFGSSATSGATSPTTPVRPFDSFETPQTAKSPPPVKSPGEPLLPAMKPLTKPLTKPWATALKLRPESLPPLPSLSPLPPPDHPAKGTDLVDVKRPFESQRGLPDDLERMQPEVNSEKNAKENTRTLHFNLYLR
jgi:hypothetical protein